MKNFPVTVDGVTYWVARASAAAMLLIYNGCILAVKRGKAVHYPGKWSLPGGFLDYDETLFQCALRELFEETGVKLNVDPKYVEGKTLDDPKYSKRQIITTYFKYVSIYPIETNDLLVDKDETTEIKWIPINDIPNYDWIYNEEAQKELWSWF